MLVPGEGPGGLIGDLVIGIVGALLGGWIFRQLGHAGVTGLNIGSHRRGLHRRRDSVVDCPRCDGETVRA
ncbi:MAG TPA: GlsB/YeaQ/YmgE family stress response membrane protein [bacterium]|nr:GlsB/YeaQ/YmgE family stress response membrane protein [bacterium]